MTSDTTEQMDFWSHNPCGLDGDFQSTMYQRYRMEPWLPKELRTIPKDAGKYLEVGCGQGVDCYYITSQLDAGQDYTAIDYSEESVERAKSHKDEAMAYLKSKVEPKIEPGNALDLHFDEGTFDFVYSMGVLHHTPDSQKAVDEVYRVLKKGGKTKIFLYRRWSLKLAVAKFMRALQHIADKVTGKERVFWHALQGKKSGFFGSMFLECFGVPWMECYTKAELEHKFRHFSKVEIQAYGYSLPRMSAKEIDGKNGMGYFFMIDAEK